MMVFVVGGNVCFWGCGEDGQLGYGDVNDCNLLIIVSVFDDCVILVIMCGVDYIMVWFDFIRIVYSWGW